MPYRMSSVMLVCLAVISLAPPPAFAPALHCAPGGDTHVSAGATVTLSASVGSTPPGSTVDNYQFWINGVAYPGPTYNLVTSSTLRPYEYIYYATATLHVHGQTSTLDSRNGDGRSGDILVTDAGSLDSILYSGDYLLYQRDWTDGTNLGRDVPRPQWSGSGSFPVCYQRGSAVTINFHTSGSGTNNNVTLKYSLAANIYYLDPVTGELVAENVPGWGPTGQSVVHGRRDHDGYHRGHTGIHLQAFLKADVPHGGDLLGRSGRRAHRRLLRHDAALCGVLRP